jgi:nucleoid-associated protein EbfC
MFNKLKNIKDLRDQAKQIQSQLAEVTEEGSGAWGKVKIVMNGNQEVISVTIDSEIQNDLEKIQNGVKEATNDAVKKVQRAAAMKMQQSGMGFPGM